MSCKCKNHLTLIGKPKNKIDCVAWLLLNVFGCKFCETCRDKPCNIKDGELCTDNIANYIREAVKEENKPTADVVEVIHAQWIERIDPLEWCEDDVDVYYECSNCSCNSHGQSLYCPNCGAKMDVAWINGDYEFCEV